MEKSYKISRVILAVMIFVIFNIMFINEDVSWKIIPFIFAIIVFGISFPSSVISKKLINIGNKLKSKLLRIFYYVIALPIISFFIFGVIGGIMYFINENIPTSHDLASALGQGLTFLFWEVVVFICVILPYIQTVIVLVLNHFVKN